jgi:hypothetical protein
LGGLEIHGIWRAECDALIVWLGIWLGIWLFILLDIKRRENTFQLQAV